MISYDPFWATLEKSDETTYALIKKGIPSSTIQRMRSRAGAGLSTLNDLCYILNCKIEDIIQYIPDQDEPKRIASRNNNE